MTCTGYRRWGSALAAITCGWAVTAFVAAQEPPPRNSQVTGREDESIRQADRDRAASLRLVRASRLMDAKVIDPGGDRLGSINNLAVNTDHGRIAYAVLSFGGFMGVGDKLFAVPWPALQVQAQDRIVLNTDKDALRDMPGFKGNDWPATADARWLRNGPGPSGFAQAGAEEREHLPHYTAKGSDLIGNKVRNEQGDDLGALHDLVIEPRSGRIIYAVIAHGGTLGVGSKLMPVPWAVLDTQQKDHLRLNIDRARFDTAPSFGNDNWAVLSEGDFSGRVYSFYGQKPLEQSGDMGQPPKERERDERP